MRNCDLDLYFEILTFTEHLIEYYGVGALPILQEVAFQDTDLNVGNLLSLIVRIILRKCDSTEVNLQDNKTNSNLKAAKSFQVQT